MAQRDKKVEEPTELHAPEITLCANNCGFPGNPATKNLCQNCFLAASSTPPTSVLPPAVFPPRPAAATAVPASAAPVSAAAAVGRPAAEPKTSRSSVNRCHSCRKRVGLTGFRCRCGELFCGAHRYSDRHECSYDYKSVGRDAIARENPVVRAAKIVRF
jgi:hypothetical protein